MYRRTWLVLFFALLIVVPTFAQQDKEAESSTEWVCAKSNGDTIPLADVADKADCVSVFSIETDNTRATVSVSGTVYAANGVTPLVNIPVRVRYQTYIVGYSYHACTDANGNYTLTGIQAGTGVNILAGGNSVTCSNTAYKEKYYYTLGFWKFYYSDETGKDFSLESNVVANPPTKPALVSPDNNAVIVGDLPLLVWNVNPAAQQVNRYRVIVRDNANKLVKAAIVDPAICSTTCELDTATLGVAFKNAKYTWQVEARNVKGTKLSDIRAFTPQLPGRPLLLTPIDTNTSPTPTFTWELRGTPLEYRVEIFDAKNVRVYQSAFELLATLGCDSDNTCEFVLPTNLPNGVYTWRVIARNTSDYSGLNSISAVKTFTVFHPAVPTIDSPKDDVSVNSAKPLMMWTDTLNGANVEYRVLIRKASDNKPAYTSAWLNRAATLCDGDTECEFTLDLALPNGAYNWFLQVRETINSVNYVKRTPGFASFKVLFPDRPVPQSPTDTTVNTPTPTFVWGEVTNATEYRVLVRNAATLKTAYNSGWQTVTCASAMCEFTATKSLPNGDYQWRIEARNLAEAPNIVWSAWRKFTVKSPGVVGNLGGSIIGELTWDAATSATEYRVQIQRTPANTAAYTSAWLACTDPTCTHTPGVMLANGNYRWRVQARNANGFSNSAWVTQSIP